MTIQLAGAVIAVECHSTVDDDRVFRKEVKTSIDGVFRFHLKGVGVRVCSAKLLSSTHPFCSIGETSSNSDSSLRQLKKLGIDGVVHVYSVGFFTFRPINQPNMCKKLGFMPPNPFQPPSLFPPPPLFPPNPFQPPPSIFPPNPFQPTPPPPIIPPNPFRPAQPPPILPPYPFLPSPPPPPPLFHFPKIPGLRPPSPPPPPLFHFPKIPGLRPPSPPPPFFHIPKIPSFFNPPSPPPLPRRDVPQSHHTLT